MRGMHETLTKIPGNLLEVSGECYHSKVPGKYLGRFQGIFKKIPGYIQEVSGECSDSEEYSRKFWWMFEKVTRNSQKNSGESLRIFWEIFEKIPGNIQDLRECSRRFRGMFK